MKAIGTKLFSVNLTYNIEANDAIMALDEVLGKHPLKPIAFNCEPIDCDCDDD